MTETEHSLNMEPLLTRPLSVLFDKKKCLLYFERDDGTDFTGTQG